MIAPSTRALIGERFDCADLGTHRLKGFSEPVRVCRVVAPRSMASRFEAAQPSRMLPLVNRDEYTAWLRTLWHEAEHARGRVALLSGEAGIGKSRIVEALRESIAGTPYAALRYQCSPHYVNTALHPVIEHIERAAGIGREDTPDIKLDRLSSWLGTGGIPRDALPLLAALLSIPEDGGRFAMPAMSPQRQKERTFELLVSIIQKRASLWPLPVVFEDVHWMDPTTQEFLTVLIDRAREMRALVVITFRPEFSAPKAWLDHAHVDYRAIEKLARARTGPRCVGRRRSPAERNDRTGRRENRRRSAIYRGTDQSGARHRRFG